MALETTPRVRGLYGTAHFGETATATDVYAGGEIRNWALNVDVTDEDSTVLAELDYVGMPTLRKTGFTCEKLLVTASLLLRIYSDPVVYVALYLGRSQTVTSGNGALAAYGLVTLGSYRLQNARGPVLIDVGGTFNGTVNTS